MYDERVAPIDGGYCEDAAQANGGTRVGGKTFAECTQLCLDSEGCEFFSYQHDSTRQCLLKGGHCCGC